MLLCKYTWKVGAYIVITNKKQLGLDIWLETTNQNTNTNDIILTTQYKKTLN